MLNTSTLNIESHSEIEESPENSCDKKERTDKTHTTEKDSRTDVFITLSTSHTETMSKPFEEEPIDKNLHFHPIEQTKSNGDTIAEEHFNDTETEDADQRRQANPEKSSSLDEKESNRTYSSTYQRCRQITSKAHDHRNRFKLGRPISTGQKVFLENHAQDLIKSEKLK